MKEPSGNRGKKVKKISFSKGKVTVSFDISSIVLSENAFTEFTLYEGKEVSDKEFGLLEEEARLDPYVQYANKALASRPYTVKEISDKLHNRGAYKKQVDKIVSRLKKQGLLDDEEYAKDYLDSVANPKALGRRRIKEELKQKGIDEKIISSLPFPREKEIEKASRYLESLERRLSSVPNRTKKEKAIALLMQRGFDRDVSLEVTKDLEMNDALEENARLQKDYNKAMNSLSRRYEGFDLKQRVIASLLRKGYGYEDIKEIMEESYESDQ